MRERAMLIGGDLEIRSESGRGTEVLLSVPVRAESR
jgi:signal transduction histidine kinase